MTHSERPPKGLGANQTDRVGGQLHGDKECSFSGVTKSGRVWRKVPESDARSVGLWKQPSAIVQELCESRGGRPVGCPS